MSDNVYYLPAVTPALPRSRASAVLRLRLCLLTFWLRLRVTVTDVVGAVRRFGDGARDAEPLLLDHRADLVLAAARAPRRPATILDFAAARARRRA